MHKIGHSCFRIEAKGNAETEVFIYGDIGENIFGDSVEATEFVQALQEVDAEVITARVNSYGGSVSDGLAIYNALRRHPATVNVEIDGIAASIASLIAMAGDYVGIAENARLMIHAPWAGAVGNAKHMRDVADQLDGWAESMATAYTRKGMTHDDAMALLTDGDDHWFGASQALEAGLVDNVTDALQVAAMYQDNRFTQPKEAAKPTAASTVAAPTEEPKMADDTKATVTEQSKLNVVEIEAAAEKKVKAEIAARNQELRILRGIAKTDAQKAIFDEAIANPTMSKEDVFNKIAGLPEDDEVGPAASHASIEIDATDKWREGATAALAHRMGVGQDDRQNPYRGNSLSEIAAESLARAGLDTRGLTRSEIAGKVLAAKTTADFPLLLVDAANKSLQAAYDAFPSTWNRWCATGSVPDFKTANLIRMGSFNSLDTIAENDPYTEGAISEEREQLTAVTKGKYIGLSRKMIINDDLQGFSRMASLLGRAAARTVNKDVYTALTSGVSNNGPTMSDTNQLFDNVNHGNLAASGGAISVATVGAGRVAMRTQQDPSGHDYLNIFPSTFLVPVALEDTARVLMASEYDPDDTGNTRSVNPLRGAMEVVSDPYLDAVSATAWYLVASPMDAPLMEVHFLEGNQTPYLEEEVQFMTDEVRWKVRMDYGVAANDWRGGYKNAGA